MVEFNPYGEMLSKSHGDLPILKLIGINMGHLVMRTTCHHMSLFVFLIVILGKKNIYIYIEYCYRIK